MIHNVNFIIIYRCFTIPWFKSYCSFFDLRTFLDLLASSYFLLRSGSMFVTVLYVIFVLICGLCSGISLPSTPCEARSRVCSLETDSSVGRLFGVLSTVFFSSEVCSGFSALLGVFDFLPHSNIAKRLQRRKRVPEIDKQ